jgi:hypothetical protein
MVWDPRRDFIGKLEDRICPHCDRPIKGTVSEGYWMVSDPCGCHLYRMTIERGIKVVSLDEYRSAKRIFLKMKRRNPSYIFSFAVHCQLVSRFRGHLMAKGELPDERPSSG